MLLGDVITEGYLARTPLHEMRFLTSAQFERLGRLTFPIIAEPDATHATSDESLDVRCWPVDALPATFDDMYVLVDAAVARVRSRQSVSTPGGGSRRAPAE